MCILFVILTASRGRWEEGGDRVLTFLQQSFKASTCIQMLFLLLQNLIPTCYYTIHTIVYMISGTYDLVAGAF